LKEEIISVAEERSQEKLSPGKLYIVGLPIGNPEDITLRALRLLRQADVVATKEPQQTQALLHHYQIRALITTYDRRSAQEKIPVLMHYLRTGRTVVLVSNGGTPCLYDPGARLVAHAYRAGVSVVSVPGPSALTASLAIAGMSGDTLYFGGRFPTAEAAGTRLLGSIKAQGCTSIFFVLPEKLRMTLALIEQHLGNRKALIAVDLTKSTESILRGKIKTLLGKHALRYPNAEVTLVIAGR
jgi:16S rRNA (cytidine1402-2'-O)-methyltransferase